MSIILLSYCWVSVQIPVTASWGRGVPVQQALHHLTYGRSDRHQNASCTRRRPRLNVTNLKRRQLAPNEEDGRSPYSRRQDRLQPRVKTSIARIMADTKKSGAASRLVRIDPSLEREPVALRWDTSAISNDGAGAPPLRTPKAGHSCSCRNAAEPDVVDPSPGFGDRSEQSVRLSRLSAGFAQGA